MRRVLALALLALTATGAQAAHSAAKDTVVLSVSVSGSGQVTSGDGQISCPGSCSGKYDSKTDVGLSAIPDKGSEFSSWSGCDSQKGTSCSVTMTKDRSVEAVFTTPPPPTSTFTLSVSVNGAGQVKSLDGKISCPGTCSSKYDAKTDVTLSATPDKGSGFSGWKGCDSEKGTDCLVTITQDRSVQAAFTATPLPPPPLPQSPLIRITAPGAGAFFTRPGDLLVTMLVTVRSLPTFFCFSVDDALTPPDPCNSATSHGLGNGSYTRPVAGLHSGRNTVTAWAVDSHGQVAHDSRVFEIASATSGIDLRTQTIEPTQGIQFWGLPRTDVSPGGSRSGVYNGVRLTAGGRTVVRVYADAASFGRAGSISGARMRLFGYRGESGFTLLPGAPLAPIYSPLSLALDSSDVVTPVQRLRPGGAYAFDLPESWTHGTIRLLASLNALGTSPSIAECCYANNEFLLTEVRFYDVDPITITPLQVIWRPAGGAYTRPAPYLEAFADAVNLVPNRVTLNPYRATVDVSAAYARNPTLMNRDRAEWDVLDAMTDMYDIVGKTGYGVGVSRGWIAGMTGWYLRYGNVASTNSDRPKTSVAHEFGHELGFSHASTACGGGDNGQHGEDWPPDQRGYIQGIALDRRPGSGGTLGPYRVDGSGTWYDYMSYCANTNDSDSWISVRNWQRLMGGPSTQPDHEAIRVLAAWRAVGPTLHVVARVNGSEIEIIRVQPGRGSQTPAGSGSPYRFVVRNAGGNVISTTPVRIRPVHIDRSKADESVLVADVPATGATAIEVVSGNAVLATRKTSPTAPRVKIVSPVGGSTIGRGPTVTVQWQAADKDGGARTARLDYSRDDGRTWIGIGSTDGAMQMALPSSYFSAAKTARVRVTVNDGFRETSAVSGRFTSLGAPPSAAILQPGSRGETIPADAALQLVGQAFDDTGTVIPGSSLSWFDGTRLLGKGTSVLARDLRPGVRLIRLVAHDRTGRSGSAVVRVHVRAVAPYFLRLAAPKQLARTARSVRLVVSSSVAATLRAGGRSFAVDRRVRRVTVPVRPGRGTLSLPLVLSSGGKTTRVKLAISRP